MYNIIDHLKNNKYFKNNMYNYMYNIYNGTR